MEFLSKMINIGKLRIAGILLLLIVAQLKGTMVYSQVQDTLKTEDVVMMSLADLMNIQVTTASRTKQSLSDVPATVHVITASQINERAYLTLEEALSDLPGIQFRNIQGFNSYVFMRGAPSQNNLILLMIDGVQVNELNSGGFYGGGQFDMAAIEQIEVVYGPASSLYGTNAVSGIINIITKKPDSSDGRITLAGGSFNTAMGGFGFRRYNSEKESGFMISGQYKTTEKADLRGTRGDNNWSDSMENFENNISVMANFKVSDFAAGITYHEKVSSMTTNFKSTDDIYFDRGTKWDIMFLNGYINHNFNPGKNLNINTKAYYRNSTVKPNTIYQVIRATDTTSGDQIGYFRPNSLVGVESQVDYFSGKRISFIGGIIGESERLSEGFSITHSNSFTEKPEEPSKPPTLSNYLLSYYSQIQLNIKLNLNFTAGIRHDFSSYYGQVIIPRFAIVYSPENFSIKGLYNRAFRSPKPWDYTYGTGNPNLEPERMRSAELAFSTSQGSNLYAGVSLFYNVIEDKHTPEVAGSVTRWINKDKLETTGFEIFGNYKRDRLSLYANYTFNDSRDQLDLFVAEISKHNANLGGSYSISKNIGVSLRANYLGDRTNPTVIESTGNNFIPGAVIINGAVTWRVLKNLNLQLKANNILNKEYYHTSNRFNGRYRQPQRSVVLFIGYVF